jgi:hypothetical protein
MLYLSEYDRSVLKVNIKLRNIDNFKNIIGLFLSVESYTCDLLNYEDIFFLIAC